MVYNILRPDVKIYFRMPNIMYIFTLSNKLTHRYMISTFDRSNLEQIRREINNALAAITAKHGLDISIGSISFNAASFTTKLTCRTRNTDAANQANTHSLRGLGLPASAIGRTIVHEGIAYNITGINKRKRSCPVETRSVSDNTLMSFPAPYVASLLSANDMGG